MPGRMPLSTKWNCSMPVPKTLRVRERKCLIPKATPLPTDKSTSIHLLSSNNLLADNISDPFPVTKEQQLVTKEKILLGMPNTKGVVINVQNIIITPLQSDFLVFLIFHDRLPEHSYTRHLLPVIFTCHIR